MANERSLAARCCFSTKVPRELVLILELLYRTVDAFPKCDSNNQAIQCMRDYLRTEFTNYDDIVQQLDAADSLGRNELAMHIDEMIDGLLVTI